MLRTCLRPALNWFGCPDRVLVVVLIRDDGEFKFFRGIGRSCRPGSGGICGGFRSWFCRSRRQLDNGIGRSGSCRTLLVAIGEFAVAGGFFGISGFGIDVLQSAAADTSFSETRGPSVQSGEALVQAKIVGRLRQSGHQRAQSLGGHVVRNEKFRVGKSGANCEGDGVGIMLVDGGSSGFQFVDDDGGFFRGNQFFGGRSTELADHLLVIVHVQGIARLHGGELLIKIAGAGQIAGLDRSVSQQLDDFGEMGGLSGFLEEIEKLLERSGIVAHMPDDGVQVL